MIDETEAYARLAEVVQVTSRTERISLDQALGRTAATVVRSRLSIPRFDNAMVDGYALPIGEHSPGTTYRVVGEQPAGRDRGFSLGDGEAIRIFTGAPLPKGTGSVIMQEVVRPLEGGTIRIEERSVPDGGVRRVGDDLCEGQVILSAGEVLTPQRLALLASQGCLMVDVRARVRGHVISTGDELKALGEPLEPGELYESNALMLSSLAEQQGFPGWMRAHVADDPDQLRAAIAVAAKENDFLFLSGGVSVGDHDHVRSVVASLGMREHFWRVRVQPGKPVLFATLGDCYLLGLPGNPVSSFVSFHLFGVPALRHWMGLPLPPRLEAVLKRPVENKGPRPHYVRGQYDPSARTFDLVGLQKSHGMLGLSKANALARLPDETALRKGDEVEVLLV